METKLFNEKSYRIHTLKTNRYKTTKIIFTFRNKVDYKTKYLYSILGELLVDTCKKYNNRREMTIARENLYNFSVFPNVKVIGDVLDTRFNFSFINPEYIDEKDYLENIIKFITEIILKPNIEAGEFANKAFNILKNEILLDIDKDNEHGESIAFLDTMALVDDNFDLAYRYFGKKEIVSKVTPEQMYKFYLDFINNSSIDIFVCGNTNTDNIVTYLKKYFINHHIKEDKFNYYKEHSLGKKVTIKENDSVFGQSQLLCVYNVVNLTQEEKEVIFKVMNCILGSGGLESKLYQKVREQNGYCYGISSMFFEYDNLLCICSSLAYKNAQNAIKLINLAIKEMQKGDFTDEELTNAKKTMMLDINIAKSNPNYLLNNYMNTYFYGAYNLEKKIELLENTSRKDIMNVAKKLKENIYYILSEDKHE